MCLNKECFSQNTYKNRIKIAPEPKNKKIIAPLDIIVVATDGDEFQNNDLCYRAALILRKVIRNINPNKLGENITLNDIINGECGLPTEITSLYATFLAGCNYRRRKSIKTVRLANSFASDIMHAVTIHNP